MKLSPDEIKKSWENIGRLLGREIIGINQNEDTAAAILSALEISSFKLLKYGGGWEYTTVANKNEINYRANLQALRDYKLADLASYADEIRSLKEERQTEKVPPLYPDEARYIFFTLKRVADAHLELAYNGFWKNQETSFKEDIYQTAAREFVDIIQKTPPDTAGSIEEPIRFTLPPRLEELFEQKLGIRR